MASFRESFSPPTVGAYRIRPDVGEQGMTAASIPSHFRESPIAWRVRRCGGRMRYAPTFLLLIRWGCGEGWHHFVIVFRRQL